METTVNEYAKVEELILVRKNKIKVSDRPKISNSYDSVNIFRDNWNPDSLELYESFKIMLFNRNMRVLGIYEVSRGSGAGCVVDTKFVFGVCLLAGACSMILAHNHPSGNLKFSKQDVDLTCKLKEAGKLLDIDVLDHVVITLESYSSMADNELI